MKKLAISLITLVSGMALSHNSYAQDVGVSLQITIPTPKYTILPVSDQIANDFNAAVQKLCAAQGRKCRSINFNGSSDGDTYNVKGSTDNGAISMPVKDACNLGTIDFKIKSYYGIDGTRPSGANNCSMFEDFSPYHVCVDVDGAKAKQTFQEFKLTTSPNMSLVLTSEPTQTFSLPLILKVQTEGYNYIPLGNFVLNGTANTSVGKGNVVVQTVSVTSIVPAN